MGALSFSLSSGISYYVLKIWVNFSLNVPIKKVFIKKKGVK